MFDCSLSLSDDLASRYFVKAWFKSSCKTPVILWIYWIGVVWVCPSGVNPAVCTLQRHSRAPWGPHQLSVFWHVIMRMAKERCHFRRTAGMDRCPACTRDIYICGMEFLPALPAYSQGTVQAAHSLMDRHLWQHHWIRDGWTQMGLEWDSWAAESWRWWWEQILRPYWHPQDPDTWPCSWLPLQLLVCSIETFSSSPGK